MPNHATAAFDVTRWDETPYHDPAGGPRLSRTVVGKTFTGDLVGDSTAELLMCRSDPADPKAGAGFVASELFEGRLHGLSGTFVFQHGGLMAGTATPKTFGHIVPGSGTDELKGLTGDAVIAVDGKGKHTLTLTYEIAVR